MEKHTAIHPYAHTHKQTQRVCVGERDLRKCFSQWQSIVVVLDKRHFCILFRSRRNVIEQTNTNGCIYHYVGNSVSEALHLSHRFSPISKRSEIHGVSELHGTQGMFLRDTHREILLRPSLPYQTRRRISI